MGNRILSGMRPTGNLHLGNYFGAIKQFLDLQGAGHECFFFAADLHALTEVTGPTDIDRLSVEVVKNYLACGIDPAKSVLYRQSDVPEVSQISTLLGNVVTVAEMLRCTTYKGKCDDIVKEQLVNTFKIDKDEAKAIIRDGKEGNYLSPAELRRIENGFSYGLLGYPVLMASDILCIRADVVPVGKDQTQHVEMARDMAKTFNHLFKREVLTVPTLNEESPVTVRGIDGTEKMGKSAKNTIALLESLEEVKRKTLSIPTQSEPGGDMEPGTLSLYTLMDLCSPQGVYVEYLRRYHARDGKFFGEMKKRLAADISALLEPIQARYATLSNDDVRDVLAQGATKVRSIAGAVLEDMQRAMGLKGGG